MRLGYDIRTGVRFNHATGGERPASHMATVHAADGTELLRLTYGHAATLWRINLGWRRRADKAVYGFVLDTERGYWARNQVEPENDSDDPMSPVQQRVIPYVQDRRNCLLIEPAQRLPVAVMASLEPA